MIKTKHDNDSKLDRRHHPAPVLAEGRKVKCKDMIYRAKITKCQAKVESLLNLNSYGVLHDARDTYIEVPDETLATLIEAMEKAEEQLSKAYLDFIHYIYER